MNILKKLNKRDLTKGNKNKISLTRAETLVDSIMKLLKESDKKSMISFTYTNMASGIKAQEILIDLGRPKVIIICNFDFNKINFKSTKFN